MHGEKVLVVDRRTHIGGNAYDHYDDAGVLVHKYGPHIFHTNTRDVFDYLSRFTEWRPYSTGSVARVDGQLVPIPINLDTINTLYGLNLSSMEMEQFFAWVAEPREPDSHLGGRGRQQGGPRAVREVLPQLHPQAVGTGPVASSTRR